MQVAFYLAGEITQVLDAIPWVSCASGNVLHYKLKKNKQHHFRTSFRPNQKSKIARNGKTNTNPTGSSHGEQLVENRLTLLRIITFLNRDATTMNQSHFQINTVTVSMECPRDVLDLNSSHISFFQCVF